MQQTLFRRLVLYGVLLLVFVVFFIYYFFFRIPPNFNENTTVRIESGKSLIATSEYLKNQGIINSSFWLINLVILFGGEHRVVAGDYLFKLPANLFTVASRITHGNYQITPVKVTIPEGMNVYEISDLLSKKFNLFDSVGFLELAKDKEGYLFPDTYFFLPNTTAAEIIEMMQRTFTKRLIGVESELASSSHTQSDIITMASILEEEARTTEDRKIVAGILWRRIQLGIALQVDSSFKYINGKSSSELTLTDLKIKSPYNTYTNRGLPPTPISNPGLDSIKAVLEPTSTDYLYFLSDKNGEMHYAKTLKEHAINRAKYL